MTAALNALDALDAARRKVSLPWKVDGLPLIDSDDSWAFRGHWHTPGPDASEKDKRAAVEDAESEGVYVVAAVNLSAPLAAVVRAAIERPWWRQWSDVDGETGAFIAENMECHVCGFARRDTDPVRHADSCEMADLDAALDAFNAAALAQGFQP